MNVPAKSNKRPFGLPFMFRYMVVLFEPEAIPNIFNTSIVRASTDVQEFFGFRNNSTSKKIKLKEFLKSHSTCILVDFWTIGCHVNCF